MIRYRKAIPFTKRTLLGHPFTVYREEVVMPRIDDKFLDCSVYLYPCKADAERGHRIGGCGFLVAMSAARNWLIDGQCPLKEYHHCYVVSNRHVAEKAPVVRLNTHDGRFDVIDLSDPDWHFSSDYDVAASCIAYNKAIKYLFIETCLLLSRQVAASCDVGIGDEVFMVGRYIGHDGKQRNSPSVRWGHVSMMPGEPVYHPSNPAGEEEAFIVEIHSIPGYGGSPVFVRPFPTRKLLPSHPINTAVTNIVMSPKSPLVDGGPWLLGVEWGYINTHNQSDNNSGMSAVAPAWAVLDLLNTDKIKSLREAEQRRLVEVVQRGGTTLT